MVHRLLALVALVLAAVAQVAPAPAAAQSGPIKIGLLSPLSGAASAIGKDMLNGTELYLDEIGRQVAGRKIELIVEDTEGVTATALTRSRKLVDQDHIHILTGALLASTGYALHPFVDSVKIPATYPVMSSDDLTQRKPAHWVVRTGWNSSQSTHAFGEWVAKNLKYKKIATVGFDYAFGWESVGGFQRTFEEQGDQIVQKIWTPLNTTDFSPFIAQIRRDVDAVFVVFFGRGSLQFVKQYSDSGLKAKIPLLGNGTTTDESVLPQMGDEALGVYTTLHYSAALDNPANKRFAKAFEAKAGKIPSYYAETCYTNARWIVEAVKAIGGKVENREAFLAALKKVELKDFPRGPVVIDRWGNPIQNVYIRKVERVGGQLQNSVIFTYPQVSQFWKYNPEEFLKMPVYTRDYPPCKFC
ncbi:MAG TPA: ABC transporter substrate-binding protein [Methylomirabilota bacterium]|jgi:branched-chain amino acid transport system substrate-binding protein|nr:ABC transporter substrate-binding protein [Methylomirabilota bacterium]